MEENPFKEMPVLLLKFDYPQYFIYTSWYYCLLQNHANLFETNSQLTWWMGVVELFNSF